MEFVRGYATRPMYPEYKTVCPTCESHHAIVSLHQDDYNALWETLTDPERHTKCAYLESCRWGNVLLTDDNVAVTVMGL